MKNFFALSVVVAVTVLTSCTTNVANTTEPSKAIDADTLFINKANALQVVKDDDNYGVVVESDDGSKTTYFYYPAENKLSSYSSDVEGSTFNTTLFDVEPQCEDRKVSISRSEGFSFESAENLDNPEPRLILMTLGEYRLLCTDY